MGKKVRYTAGGPEVPQKGKDTRKFNGKVYYLYGTGATRETAKRVGKAVRDNGGLARVIGLKIYVRKTAIWR